MQAIERILRIIETIGSSPTGLTLSEVHRATGLSPATCHRLLASLCDTHLLERDASSKRYRAGIGLIRLAASVNPSTALVPSADMALRALRDRWQECFYLAVLANDSVVCLESVETTEPNRMGVYLRLGYQLSVHGSASARAILAFVPEDVAKRVLQKDNFEKYTEFTKTKRAALASELEATRKRGYAVCDQELEIGVVAFATPVLDISGEPTRSIGVIGPRERLLAMVDDGLIDDMLASARYLSGKEDALPLTLTKRSA
jgi:DNA-binding IclR family transcriptional regulator